MKALNLYGVNDLRLDEVSRPVRQPGEVLLRVRAAGICGSDIPRVFVKGTYHYPTIIGHEFAGEIIEADDGDAALVGRGAAVFPLLPCRKCGPCEAGHYAQCEHYSYYGSRQDGGMAEYIAVRRENLSLMPEDVSYEAAAMSEPTAVALHALRRTGMQLGQSVLIYGVGAIGLLIAQLARAAGAAHVILAARSAAKVRMAQERGFDETVDVNRVDLREYVQDITGGGADVCIEATGTSVGLEACVWAARTFGTVLTLGNPLGDMQLTQDGYWQILRRELRLLGTWNSSFAQLENDWRDVMVAMKAGRLDPASLITHRYRLEEHREAFTLMHEKRESYLKVMFVAGEA